MKINLLVGLYLLPLALFAQWQPQNNASTDVGNIYHLNGDVGIGTPSPGHTLSLFRAQNASLGIVTDQSTSEASLLFRINSTVRDASIVFRSNGRLAFNLDGPDGGYIQDNEFLTILNTGNIGMGIVTPYSAARLHIKSPSANVWGLITEAASNTRIIGVGHSGDAGYVSVGFLNGAGFTPLHFNTSGLTRMSVGVDGKVGIGTNSPEKLLQLHSSDNPSIAIGKLNTNTMGKSSLVFYAGDGSVANGFTLQYMRQPNIDRLGFLGGGGVEHLSILNSGFVGIGTNTPDAKLAVKGVIHTQEVRVDMTGAMVPDYVFEKNYNLRPLAEVENYINQNKHLPEVPAAKEMEANGVNLGEMNMLLLKKVEELTLYMIELKKENIDQRKQNARLQDEIESILPKLKSGE
jgi:hypothetical protein